MNGWNHDYAAAMSPVHAAFPQDLDVIALYAEAMMMRTPWKLWDTARGEPATDASTVEMMAVLESGLSLADALRRIAETEPRRLSACGGRFPSDLETILAKALATDRDRRYSSAS